MDLGLSSKAFLAKPLETPDQAVELVSGGHKAVGLAAFIVTLVLHYCYKLYTNLDFSDEFPEKFDARSERSSTDRVFVPTKSKTGQCIAICPHDTLFAFN